MIFKVLIPTLFHILHPFLTIYKRWSISHHIRHVQWDWLPPSIGVGEFLFFENFSIKQEFCPQLIVGVILFGYWTLNNWWFNNYLSSTTSLVIACQVAKFTIIGDFGILQVVLNLQERERERNVLSYYTLSHHHFFFP